MQAEVPKSTNIDTKDLSASTLQITEGALSNLLKQLKPVTVEKGGTVNNNPENVFEQRQKIIESLQGFGFSQLTNSPDDIEFKGYLQRLGINGLTSSNVLRAENNNFVILVSSSTGIKQVLFGSINDPSTKEVTLGTLYNTSFEDITISPTEKNKIFKTNDIVAATNFMMGLSDESKKALEGITYPTLDQIISFVGKIKTNISTKQEEWKQWKAEQELFKKGNRNGSLKDEPKLTLQEEEELRSLSYFLVQRTDGGSFSAIFKDLTGIDAGYYNVDDDGDIFPAGCPCDFTRSWKKDKPSISFQDLITSKLQFDPKQSVIKY